MRLAIVSAFAILAGSGPALAQMYQPRHYDNGDVAIRSDDASDGPGNGLQLELNVFREATVYSSDALVSVVGSIGSTTTGAATSGAFVSTLQPLVLVGYQADQNAILLGIGVAAIGGSGGGGNITYFGVSPTYRRYFSPLRTGKISVFAEGGVTFDISLPSGGSSSWGFGVDVGAGAEWLFVRNFGLFGKALIAYGHVNQAGAGTITDTGTGGSSTNLDAAGLIGDVGLSVHL